MSWQNNTAPGFLYFNPQNAQNYQNKNDRSDFLSFDNPQNAQNSFWPNMCSSPQKNHKSPRNFKQRNKFQRYSSQGFNRSNNSSNNSFNSSNNSPRKWDKRQSYESQNYPQEYIEPTCLRNPWEKLERQQKQQEEEESQKSKETLSNQDNESDNSSSGDESAPENENESTEKQ